MEENRGKHNQKINHNQCIMLLLMHCYDNVVTPVDLNFFCIGIRAKQQ